MLWVGKVIKSSCEFFQVPYEVILEVITLSSREVEFSVFVYLDPLELYTDVVVRGALADHAIKVACPVVEEHFKKAPGQTEARYNIGQGTITVTPYIGEEF